jgi:hypothetical protein
LWFLLAGLALQVDSPSYLASTHGICTTTTLPLLWIGVQHHPPGRTDKNLCALPMFRCDTSSHHLFSDILFLPPFLDTFSQPPFIATPFLEHLFSSTFSRTPFFPYLTYIKGKKKLFSKKLFALFDKKSFNL